MLSAMTRNTDIEKSKADVNLGGWKFTVSRQTWWGLQEPKHVKMIIEYAISILEMAWLVENI